MKKIALTFILLFALTLSVLAEGEIHTGGRSCPQGQPCFTEGEYLAGGKSENPIYQDIFDFLKSIFE